MGKIRAKTLGDEEQEKKEREEAEKRRLAKIALAKKEGQEKKSSDAKAMDDKKEDKQPQATKEPVILTEQPITLTKKPVILSETKDLDSSAKPQNDKGEIKKKVQKKGPTKERSEKYKTARGLIEKGKTYSLSQGLDLLEKTHLAAFDETVELHINTIGPVSGGMQLPHGSGKSTRVAILAPSKDAAGADALLKEIESGKIHFDVLIATPDAMPRLAKVARILGPKGLMPNPKNGTVTPKPEDVAKKYEGGHMTFKTESKAPVLHLSVGKLSFGKDKLEENIKAAYKAVDGKNMKKVILKSTMSPAIRLSI